MKRHSRSIYGCTQAPARFKTPQDCRLTYDPDRKRVYVHVFAWPFRHLHLEGFAGSVAYAQLLNDASEVRFQEPAQWAGAEAGRAAAKTLRLELPVVPPDVTVPVVELFLK
jgi:alpha-L-fucosidase